MAVETTLPLAKRGGGWLLERPETIFTPELFDDTTLELVKMTRQFVEREVMPLVERMEHGELDLNVPLMEKLGELGPVGLEVPAAYGGLEMSKTVGAAVFEEIAPTGGFSVTFAAHVSIGTLPLVYFGTEEQKRTYLPKLASGEWIGAYALTEPGSGSDALAARCRATLSEDGKYYLLNGTKQFITNSQFAQLFTVFAKVDGEKFTAFLVERDFPGVGFGEEERKMGIKSSSTRQLILQDARVPVENVLYEIGQGHRIAFNVLNVGRYKIGAGGAAGAKNALRQCAVYAKGRKQFGRPIADFALIRQKLAQIATRAYATESALYRTTGAIDEAIGQAGGVAAVMAGIHEFAVECAILKVLGSETLDFAVDEGVQIHGGYGFLQDYPIERAYRDSRINRLFEGTNEINRLLIPDQLMRRALKGDLPLIPAAMKLRDELLEPSFDEPQGAWGREDLAVANLKKLVLMLAGLGMQRFGEGLKEEQEVVAGLADIIIETYAAESGLLRAQQTGDLTQADLARLYLDDTLDNAQSRATRLLPRLAGGDELRVMLSVARRLTKREPVDTIAVQRRVAARVLEVEGYPAAG